MGIQLINKLITFEGIDGSGKSTQIRLLNEWFQSKEIKTTNIREPGGTNISEVIRKILLDNNNQIDSVSETLLFLASRSQLVNEIISPLLTFIRIAALPFVLKILLNLISSSLIRN